MKRMLNLIKKLVLTIEFLLTYDNDVMSYKKKREFYNKKNVLSKQSHRADTWRNPCAGSFYFVRKEVVSGSKEKSIK